MTVRQKILSILLIIITVLAVLGLLASFIVPHIYDIMIIIGMTWKAIFHV